MTKIDHRTHRPIRPLKTSEWNELKTLSGLPDATRSTIQDVIDALVVRPRRVHNRLVEELRLAAIGIGRRARIEEFRATLRGFEPALAYIRPIDGRSNPTLDQSRAILNKIEQGLIELDALLQRVDIPMRQGTNTLKLMNLPRAPRSSTLEYDAVTAIGRLFQKHLGRVPSVSKTLHDIAFIRKIFEHAGTAKRTRDDVFISNTIKKAQRQLR